MSHQRSSDEQDPLSEALAQRIIARAIEFDSLHANGTTVAEVRNIALEAGITIEAFELALREQTRHANSPASLASARDRVESGAEGMLVTMWKAGLLNLVVFAAVWVSGAVALVFLRELLGLTGRMYMAMVVVAILFGLELAFRTRARLVAVTLAICAAAQLASLAYSTIFNGSYGNPRQMLIAALLGLGFGVLLTRRFSGGAHNATTFAPRVAKMGSETESPPTGKTWLDFLRQYFVVTHPGRWSQGLSEP